MSQLNVTTLKHESAGVNNITLDANGRVGIGTNNPTYNLTVAGNGTSGLCAMAFVDESNSNKEWRIDQSDGALRFTESGVAERMRIDTAGRVTMPYQPMCWVVLNGTTTTAATAFTTSSLNANAGNCWNSSTHRFTAPISGYYHCTAGLYTNYTNSYGWWAFFKNGASQGTYHFNHGGYVIHEGMGATAIIYCNAGDYIQLGRPSSGGSGYFDRADLSIFLCG